MAYVKDMIIEDSEGNKYYNGLNPTKVIKNANDNAAITEEGYTPDALVTKQLIRDLSMVRTYVGNDGKLHFVNSAGADTVLPFNIDVSSKIIELIGSSKYIDFFVSESQNIGVVNGAQYLVCDIGQYNEKISFKSGCTINNAFQISGSQQPDRVPSEYIITATSSIISVTGSAGAFFIRIK